METKIEKEELDTELHELYLQSKQWITDLDYLDNELEFLKGLVKDQHTGALRKQEFEELAGIEQRYTALKQDMAQFQKRLEPFIVHKRDDYSLDMIESYAQLQHRLSEIMYACHEARNLVLDNSKRGFKKRPML